MSPSLASSSTKAGSFFSSSLWKRVFSRQQHVAVLHRGDGLLGRLADAIVREGDRLADAPATAPRRPASANPSASRPFGRPKCASRMTLPPLPADLGDGRRDALDAGRVGDLAVLHRHVEIDAHEHALARDVGVIEGAEICVMRRSACVRRASFETPRWRCRRLAGMRALQPSVMSARRSERRALAPARSGARHRSRSACPSRRRCRAMRLEKPHSLSYHDITRTSVPFITLVWSMWNVEECGSWLKSIETLGSLVIGQDALELLL